VPTHTSFHGFANVGDAGLSDQLKQNVLAFLEWGFLGLGAWETVERSASGVYGGDLSRLRLGEDPNYASGQVWEGFRKDWVWETGVECSYQPIRVSGVWVNGTFHPATGVGAYAHAVDYPNGRVVFTTAIATSSVVQASYSYRWVQAVPGDVPWWMGAQTNSLRADSPHFLQTGSGDWSVLPQNRMQLPAIVVEAVPNFHNASVRPLALGGGRTVRQDVRLSILAETPHDRDKIHDILTQQWSKRLHAFDIDRVVAATGYPLDADGSPLSGPRMYPDLVKPYTEGGHGYNQITIADVRSAEIEPGVYGLYGARVTWSCEMDLP
jgi:hypothetical protein